MRACSSRSSSSREESPLLPLPLRPRCESANGCVTIGARVRGGSAAPGVADVPRLSLRTGIAAWGIAEAAVVGDADGGMDAGESDRDVGGCGGYDDVDDVDATAARRGGDGGRGPAGAANCCAARVVVPGGSDELVPVRRPRVHGTPAALAAMLPLASEAPQCAAAAAAAAVAS